MMGIDLKPIIDPLVRLASAFERLADAQERANELAEADR